MDRSLGKWKLPQPTDIKEDLEWQQIPRIARTVPFGYTVNKQDNTVLDPVEYELEALELARKHIKQYSYREVANWLTTKTGRQISHVGLRKRLANEQQRKNKAKTLKIWAEYATKAIEKTKAIETQRTGART